MEGKTTGPSRVKKILVYATAGILGLFVLASIMPGEDRATDEAGSVDCVDEDEFAVGLDDIMMQTGYFKTVDTLIYDGTLRLKVEPSSMGYSDPLQTKALIYAAVARAPQCLDLENVEVTLIGNEYDTLIKYPFSAAVNGTEDRDFVKSIIQK